jgi:hypothetical protein
MYSAKRCRQVGGVNKADAIKAFRSSRAYFKAGERDLGSEDSADPDILAQPLRKRRRAAYSREKKLQAITYITSTDCPKKGGEPGEMVPITLSYASGKLKVDRKNLRDWKDSKAKILGIKKGAYRARGLLIRREPELKFKLNAKFESERAIGRIINSVWFMKHVKAIYRVLYPCRFSQDEVTGRFEYTFFSFSNT